MQPRVFAAEHGLRASAQVLRVFFVEGRAGRRGVIGGELFNCAADARHNLFHRADQAVQNFGPQNIEGRAERTHGAAEAHGILRHHLGVKARVLQHVAVAVPRLSHPLNVVPHLDESMLVHSEDAADTRRRVIWHVQRLLQVSNELLHLFHGLCGRHAVLLEQPVQTRRHPEGHSEALDRPASLPGCEADLPRRVFKAQQPLDGLTRPLAGVIQVLVTMGDLLKFVDM